MSDSQMREVAGAVLPLGLLPAAAALVSDYAAVGSRVVADDLAARFGRPVTGRDVGRMWRQRPVRDPAEVARAGGGCRAVARCCAGSCGCSIRLRRTGRWPTARR